MALRATRIFNIRAVLDTMRPYVFRGTHDFEGEGGMRCKKATNGKQ